jgi:hypothetical protein
MDNATGRVCAHVLAWSARNNTAYIAPMEILLDDMANALGADVTLPGRTGGQCPRTPKDVTEESMVQRFGAAKLVDAGPARNPPSPSPSLPELQKQLSPPRSRASGSFDNTSPDHDFAKESVPHCSSQPRPQPYPTPSPSPPMATSPPCYPLMDNIVRQRFPNPDSMGCVSTTTATPSRPEMLGRGVQGRGRGRAMEVVGMRGGGGVKTRG